MFRQLARQKECEIEEGHLAVDHVHMMISVPPKYAVAPVVGYIQGKSGIHIARNFGEWKRNFVGHAATLCRRWAGMTSGSGPTFGHMRPKIDESTSWACCNAVPFRGRKGSRSGPVLSALSGSHSSIPPALPGDR